MAAVWGALIVRGRSTGASCAARCIGEGGGTRRNARVSSPKPIPLRRLEFAPCSIDSIASARATAPRRCCARSPGSTTPGEKVGLVGRNGAGKTTLLRIALGREEPDAGRVRQGERRADRDRRSERSSPTRPSHSTTSPRAPSPSSMRSSRSCAAWSTAMADGQDSAGAPRPLRRADPPLRERGRLRHGGRGREGALGPRIRQGRLRAAGSRSSRAARRTGRCSPARSCPRPTCSCSTSRPTTSTSRRSSSSRTTSRASKRAYLVVTHDRRFLDRVAEEIVDLENGRLTAYSGGYTAYRRQKAERVLSATRAFEKQQEFIEKEKEYIRRNIAGVNSRQAKGRRTKLERVERLEKPTEDTHVGRVPVRRGAHRRAKLPAGEGPRRRLRAGRADRPRRLLRAPPGRAPGDPGRERHRARRRCSRRWRAACRRSPGIGLDGPRRVDRLLRPGAARPRSAAPRHRRDLGRAPERDRGGDALVPRALRVPGRRRLRRTSRVSRAARRGA